MRVTDASFTEITNAALLALIQADPAAFRDALALEEGRIATISANYTVDEDTDNGAGLTQTGGTITLPSAPSHAMRLIVRGPAVKLQCAANMRHISSGGTQTIITANTPVIFSPLSPAITLCHLLYSGSEWAILEH